MNNVSQAIESSIQSLASSLVSLHYEVNDISKNYFATGASDAVNALASTTTPATMSGLNKNQYLNGITLASSLKDFFENAVVATLDYLASAENLVVGSSAASAVVSADVEAIGSRLKSVGQLSISYYKQAKQILDLWVTSQLSLASGALSAGTVVPGCSTTAGKFNSGIGLLTQFVNMMENAAVTSGPWGSTAAQWTQNV